MSKRNELGLAAFVGMLLGGIFDDLLGCSFSAQDNLPLPPDTDEQMHELSSEDCFDEEWLDIDLF